jgi:hypothetical protein
MNETPPPDSSSETPGALNRRGFLRGVAGGTAAIALASALPAGCAADYAQSGVDGVPLRALSPKEYAVARAAAEAMLQDVPVPPARIAATIDRELAAMGEPVRGDMKTVFMLLEHLTFLDGRIRRFSALPPDARLDILRGWARSRFTLRRAAFQATRSFIYFFAYSDDATRPLTGFGGPWPERISVPAYPIDFGEVV